MTETLPSTAELTESTDAESEHGLTTDQLWERIAELHERADAMNETNPQAWDEANPDSDGYWREMQKINTEVLAIQDELDKHEREHAEAARKQTTQRGAGGTGIKRFFMFKD